MSFPEVSIIIPSWNGAGLLPACLNALARQSFKDFQTVVVDNGSDDGTPTWLAQAHPEVHCLRLPRNLGFSAAVNKGITATSSPLIALLNNDAVPEARWLETLLNSARTHPEDGAFASKILREPEGRIDNAGLGFHRLGWAFSHHEGKMDSTEVSRSCHVFTASGAAALYRRSLFDRIGLFDEDFFAYSEDVDLGFRAQLAGISYWYESSAVVRHRGGATAKRISPFVLYLQYRNAWYVLIKDLPVYTILRSAPLLLLGQVFMLQSAWKRRHLRIYARALVDVLCDLPRLLRARRRIHVSHAHARRVDALLDGTLPRKVQRFMAYLRKADPSR